MYTIGHTEAKPAQMQVKSTPSMLRIAAQIQDLQAKYEMLEQQQLRMQDARPAVINVAR